MMMDTEHPFAAKRIHTGGHSIFLDAQANFVCASFVDS
jgi:hypothetical protein